MLITEQKPIIFEYIVVGEIIVSCFFYKTLVTIKSTMANLVEFFFSSLNVSVELTSLKGYGEFMEVIFS